MSKYTDYFLWLDDGGWIRISARAIIFNQARDHILIERNDGVQYDFSNFIGGGVETGETLQACIERELNEETNARITHAKYLFMLEHFMPHNSEVRHSLEHCFAIDLDREDVAPKNNGVEYSWCSIEELNAVDLRPVIVRDSIMDGSYKRVSHMIFGINDSPTNKKP